MPNRFADELLTLGPDAPDRVPFSVSAAEAYCRRLAKRHYENFLVGSCLLPRAFRQHFFNVYAYCRWADDLADEISDPAESLRLLDWWSEQLTGGDSRHPVFIALRQTISQFKIPHEPFLDLLAAFRRDQNQTRYATWDELLSYCELSANPVGRIVLHIGDAYDEANVRDADAICTGLQLANFWQDMRRDFQMGRVYAPAELLDEAGVQEDDFRDDAANPAMRDLVRRLVEMTEPLLQRGSPLVERVPAWLAADVRLFVGGGECVLRAIRRQQFDVLRKRPEVGKASQLRLVIAAWFATKSGSR
ncbi:MAG: squalene synthase HpnC [Pirellulaceae bacterium]|jgi:squalene synthase HpnC|nr:squalene synthase HpnC [Pirellulaceae bacterium]MDP7019073.1 squalene synthase HpnC [Pirellulaceae bacterium]